MILMYFIYQFIVGVMSNDFTDLINVDVEESMKLCTRFDYLFSVLELQCLIEFNTVIKSCHFNK